MARAGRETWRVYDDIARHILADSVQSLKNCLDVTEAVIQDLDITTSRWARKESWLVMAANWINTCDGSPQTPTNVSRGVFGATVGTDRLLKMFDRYGIKATWFTPAHTLESFPSQLAKVRDSGHEIGLHGYTHENIAKLNAQQQLDVLTRSIDAVTKFTGKKPKGYTAPLWATSKELIPQLQDAGILYDHSFMHHDVQPYWAPDTLAFSWVETNLLDDANDHDEAIQGSRDMGWAQGYVDTHSVERLWKEQFDFAYREYDEFIFPMSIHPQVSGKPQVIMMHERIIEHINKHPGVEWMTLSGMAEEFVAGRITGATIEGGVDPTARM
ncbi:hypothetical protein AC578_9746 [Pseudocercospora eumusae]|uniref:NodB homology domain-containing protein n=1 Tax=Pseudocercospora eumusae TaxID=321146 RepID=A0A139HQT4_9PEZI|nr:hypothetical protein AC578_9746 [Pseudocercospora eumusae]